MTPRRRRARSLARSLGVVLGLALAFPPLFVAFGPETPSDRVRLSMPDPRASYAVYVTNWDYHTSVTIPQPPGWRLGPPGAEDAPYLDYSWGDRAYFRDSRYNSFYVSVRFGRGDGGVRASYVRAHDFRRLIA